MSGQPKINFDDTDREANRMLNNMARRKSIDGDNENPEIYWGRIQAISNTILDSINGIFSESDEDYSKITLDDFLESLKDSPEYRDTIFKIQHFIEFFPDEVDKNGTVMAFLHKVEEKNLQAGDFLISSK